MAHAGLRGEVDHTRGPGLGKQGVHAVAVGEIEAVEGEARASLELGEPRLLEGGIVVGVHVVEADHGLAGFEQRARNMEADEACRSGDQHGTFAHADPPTGRARAKP